MPDPALLSPLGQQMLAELPPALRASTDYLAVIHAYAREIDLLDSNLELLRAQFNPNTADLLLDAWEAQVKLPAGGQPGATIAERRAAVVARIRKLLGQTEGRQWVARMTEILGPVWTYAEHDPADMSSPPEGEIAVTVPFTSGTSQFVQAELLVRDITPAHLVVSIISTAGFSLDVSFLDDTDLSG